VFCDPPELPLYRRGRCWTCGSTVVKFSRGFAGYRHADHKKCASFCVCRRRN
jgi:hypothetical protein